MDANGTKIFMSSGRHHRWSFFFDSIMKAHRQRQIRRAIKTGDTVRQRERARDCVPSVPAGYAAFGCIQFWVCRALCRKQAELTGRLRLKVDRSNSRSVG